MAIQSKAQVTHLNQGSRKRSTSKPANSSIAAPSNATDLVNVQRALANPQATPPAALASLQRTVGNRATRKLIQPKLNVGPAGDQYEQEADRVAQQVASATTAHIISF